MALEGNLTAFGLSEILQLIAIQQKTGMLTVTNVDATTVMFFRGGEIVSTRDRRRKARDAFKDYLTRYGVLDRDQLVRVSQICAQSKLDFTDVVTSEGQLTPQELLKHWHKQILEVMHDVLTWEEGTYKFVANGQVVEGISSPGAFNIEGMMMESMRRIDEFPQMLDMFPSEKLAFSPSTVTPSDDLSENERTILASLEAQATLRDLIARGKMPVFEVYEALKNLREKDLITVEKPEPETHEVADDDDEGRKPRRAFKNIMPFVMAGLMFAGATYAGLRHALQPVSLESLASIEVPSDPSITRDRVEAQLRWLIEAYHARHGDYPASLTALRDAGLASDDFLERTGVREFRYRLTENRAGYTLL